MYVHSLCSKLNMNIKIDKQDALFHAFVQMLFQSCTETHGILFVYLSSCNSFSNDCGNTCTSFFDEDGRFSLNSLSFSVETL